MGWAKQEKGRIHFNANPGRRFALPWATIALSFQDANDARGHLYCKLGRTGRIPAKFGVKFAPKFGAKCPRSRNLVRPQKRLYLPAQMGKVSLNYPTMTRPNASVIT